MKVIKDRNMFPKDKPWVNLDYKKRQRNTKVQLEREFEESMREDMRGPMEGIQDVPAASVLPKPMAASLHQSQSMLNEGGHS